MDKFDFNGGWENAEGLDSDTFEIEKDTEFSDESEFEAGVIDGEASVDNEDTSFDFDGAFDDDNWGTPVTDKKNADTPVDEGFDFDSMFDDAPSSKEVDERDNSEDYLYIPGLDNKVKSTSNDDFDIDTMFDEKPAEIGENIGAVTAEEIVVDVDLSKYADMADSGNPVVLALVHGGYIVYLAHGTQGKLAPTIKFLEHSIGANLVQIPLGDENIEELKADAKAFNLYYRKYAEGEQNE